MSNVIVLEDDHDLRTLYTKALAFRGHQVTATKSAEEAIAALDQQTVIPDVAVLDMEMEGIPGSAVVKYIRENKSLHDIPIIVVSCNESFKFELEALDIIFLTKPISIVELYNVVAKVTTPEVAKQA